MSIADNLDFLRHLPKPNALQEALGGGWGFITPGGGSPLRETRDFGANPGQLTMLSFVPDGLTGPSPLVVVLHGCTQTAAGYDVGAGWSALADRYGFALLMPEQRRGNNPNTCFNWFDAADIVRDGGEAASIRQMVSRISADHSIDAGRIFVTGLSAGGAMTSVMLATYPDVFSGGAIIAGLPYGIAETMRVALTAMRQPNPQPGEVLGDLVRNASPHKGPWPRISVWHGSADRTVNAANADEIVKQWLDLHGLPATPMAQTTTDGYPRQVWWGADGETLVESFSITDMAHGTPLGFGAGEERFGAQGPYLIDAGISSSFCIAEFFGLTGQIHHARAAKSTKASPAKTGPAKASPMQTLITPAPVKPDPESVTFSARPIDNSHSAQRRKRALDVNAVITRALTAAGLLK